MNLNLCFPYRLNHIDAIYLKASALQSKVYLYCPVKSVCISQLVCSHFIDCDMILCNVCLLWCGVWLCCGCVHSGNNNNNIMSTQQHNLMHFYWFLLKLGIKNQGQSQNGNDMQDIIDKLLTNWNLYILVEDDFIFSNLLKVHFRYWCPGVLW